MHDDLHREFSGGIQRQALPVRHTDQPAGQRDETQTDSFETRFQRPATFNIRRQLNSHRQPMKLPARNDLSILGVCEG